MIRTVSERLEPVLNDGLTVKDAHAIISALTLPEVYRDLVRDRGWTPERFQDWLEGALAVQLISVGGRIR
jgi:hypothetical protein